MKYSLGDLVDRLSIVNLKIFALENDIRKGKLDVKNTKNEKDRCEVLKEIGRRSLIIRDMNRERVALKNALNEYQTKWEAFVDYKISHSSSEDEPKFGES